MGAGPVIGAMAAQGAGPSWGGGAELEGGVSVGVGPVIGAAALRGRGPGSRRHVGAAALRPQVPEGPGGQARLSVRCLRAPPAPLRRHRVPTAPPVLPHLSCASRVLAAASASPEFSCSALYPSCISSRFSLHLPESLL